MGRVLKRASSWHDDNIHSKQQTKEVLRVGILVHIRLSDLCMSYDGAEGIDVY